MGRKWLREAFAEVFHNHQSFLFIMVLDLLFVSILFSFRGAFAAFDSALFLLRQKLLYWAWLPLYLAALGLFLMAFTAFYSLFRFGILFFLRAHVSWRHFSFDGFSSFLRFNWATATPLLFLSILAAVNIFSAVQDKVKQAQDPVTTAALFFLGIALIILLLIIFYTITNILQFAYIQGRGLIKEEKQGISKKSGMKGCYKSFWDALLQERALGFIWHDLKIIFLFVAAFAAFHYFAKELVFGDYFFYLNYYWIYQRFLWAYWSLAFYSLIIFNRVYWYRKIVGREG